MRALTKPLQGLLLILPLCLPMPLAAQEQAPFSKAELDQVLAPIALYPDTLLAHILIAATYPLEVVEAARWSRDHSGLEGETAVDAVEDRDWDPSVKALVAFPQVLARMDEDLAWTRRLGDAFLLQESQVAERIQHLRARAHEAGHLDSLEHVRVYREPETIIIEPATHHVVYVPYYDTRVVYGHWWWPAYPPVYWAYPVGYPVYYGATWFSWGPAIRISPFFFFSSFHWPHRQVVVVHHHHKNPRHHRFHSGRDVARHDGAHKWRHDPKHRRNVVYHGKHRRLDPDRGRNHIAREQPRQRPAFNSERRITPAVPIRGENRARDLQDSRRSRRQSPADARPVARNPVERLRDQPRRSLPNLSDLQQRNRARQPGTRNNRADRRADTPIVTQGRRLNTDRGNINPRQVIRRPNPMPQRPASGREARQDRNVPQKTSRGDSSPRTVREHRREGGGLRTPVLRGRSDGHSRGWGRGSQDRFSGR